MIHGRMQNVAILVRDTLKKLASVFWRLIELDSEKYVSYISLSSRRLDFLEVESGT